MLSWLTFISWIIFEYFLIKLIIAVTKEKKILVKQLQDVKVEINSTTDLMAITDTTPQEEEEEEPEEQTDWWE